ncbi:MAG: hypothetical protein IPK82_03645 [Polyangiaceae bacterium]|nr:hypothetical protein [Polyangiaceae bacterium]
MSDNNGKSTATLDAEAPGLDEMTRRRRRVLARMEQMTDAERFALAVSAGIYTSDGQLTAAYRADAEPSASRPTD